MHYILCYPLLKLRLMNKTTKIEAAIKDTKLYLKKAHEEIALWSRERNVLQQRLEALETIKDSKHYE